MELNFLKWSNILVPNSGRKLKLV